MTDKVLDLCNILNASAYNSSFTIDEDGEKKHLTLIINGQSDIMNFNVTAGKKNSIDMTTKDLSVTFTFLKKNGDLTFNSIAIQSSLGDDEVIPSYNDSDAKPETIRVLVADPT